MTLHELTQKPAWLWVLALAVVFIAFKVSGPLADEVREYSDMQKAYEDAQEQARKEYDLKQKCGGEEASYEQLADGSIQCKLKNGRKSIKVKQ